MQVSTILDIAIIALPACYAALVAVQFATGLAARWHRPSAPATTPNASQEPQEAATEQTEEVTPADPWTAPVALTEVIANDAPAVTSDQAIALLPAFIAAVQVEATADDHALVEGAWVRCYCNAGLEDVVVPFVRPSRPAQKRQEAHPVIEGMTLRAMRQLGAELKIRGARRWNTAQAREALAAHYSSAA